MADRDSFEQRSYELPPGSTEVVLVRHGASEAAVVGSPFPLVDGHSDPALSEVGRIQAATVAARLAGERIGAIFVTNLRRTQQTAEPLLAATGLEATVVPELREVYLGDFEGGEYRIRAHQGDPVVRRVFASERWDEIPGGEPADALATRTRAGIEKIVAAAGPDTSAVAVVHGGVIGELCRQAVASRPFAFIHSDNCSISRIVVNPDGRWLLRSFNDVSHLRGTRGGLKLHAPAGRR
jgi:probable phosphoglycerate mutase